MLEHERISHDPCGCRTDVVTGLTLHYCPEHDPEPRLVHGTNLTAYYNQETNP